MYTRRHDSRRGGNKYDNFDKLAEACRQSLPFLAPVVKSGEVRPQPGEGDQLPRRGKDVLPHLVFSSSLGPAAVAENQEAATALKAAVESGIRFKYELSPDQDVKDPHVAANTYAKTLVNAGYTAAQAGPVMLDAIHECIAANIGFAS